MKPQRLLAIASITPTTPGIAGRDHMGMTRRLTGENDPGCEDMPAFIQANGKGRQSPWA